MINSGLEYNIFKNIIVKSLNYLLQNIKKMIAWEDKSMRADLIKIEELLNVKKQYEAALKEKEKNQMRLLQHIGDQRQRKDKINHQLEDGIDIYID